MSTPDESEFTPAPSTDPQPLQFEDDGVRRRIRRRYGENGLSIAGFICALIGVIVSCNPILGSFLGIIGIVFGSIGLARVHRSGFAIAPLVLGILACFLALGYKPLFQMLAR